MDQYTLKDGRNRVRLLVFYCFTFFKFELNIKDSIVVNYMTFGDCCYMESLNLIQIVTSMYHLYRSINQSVSPLSFLSTLFY